MTSRITFCITTLDTGGAERQLVELAARLPRERFESAVVVLAAPPSPPRDALVARLREHSIPVTFLGARAIWQTPRVYRRLVRWFRDTRPDLVQCFLAHANVLGALAARRAGVPTIVAGIRVAEQRRNWHLAAQRFAARYVDRQVCVSQSVADFAAGEMRLPRDQIVVIPNGIDVDRYQNVAPVALDTLGVSPGRRCILFAARLEADKRPAWLLERMPEILRQLPEHDLVVAGEGPLQPMLEQQAARLGIASRVHLVGWRPDLPQVLAAADLLVLTSTAEGMSNVVLEAMASARPVVATEVHGIHELLGDDHAGQLVPVNAPAAFIDAVARLAGDAALAAQVGQRNRERVRNEFSFDRTASAYARLYDALLAAKSR